MLHSCALTLAAGALLCLMNANLHPTHPTLVIPGSGPSTGFTPEQGMGSPSGNQVGVNGNLLDQLYIRFTENCGQIADCDGKPRPDVLFTTLAYGARLYLTPNGMDAVFTGRNRTQYFTHETIGFREVVPTPDLSDAALERRQVSLRFLGCNTHPAVSSAMPCEGYENYYLAHCPQGITGVPSYHKVMYRELYDRVDLSWCSVGGKELRYEFTVRPGGNPSQIRMRFSGADRVYLDRSGNLHVVISAGEQIHNAPRSFTADGQEVGSAFAIRGKSVSFVLSPYDTDQTLTVVPWGTHFGGWHEDFMQSLAVNEQGEIGITGSTLSTDIPVRNAHQNEHAAKEQLNNDIFIAVFSADQELLWSTYFGGSTSDQGNDIAFNSIGEVCIVGKTKSSDFPLKNPYQNRLKGEEDCGVAKFSPDGSLLWSTFFGGDKNDGAEHCAVDPWENIIVTASTESMNFPVIHAFQSSLAGAFNAVMFKLTIEGIPVWSTYFGGVDVTYGGPLAIADDGNIFMAGSTTSRTLPTRHAFQNTWSGDFDWFVTRWTNEGQLIWSTYLGGSKRDLPRGLTIVPSGSCIIVGSSESRNMPVMKAMQEVLKGGSDCVVARFDTSGSLECATLLGGSADEGFNGVTSDAEGNLFVIGETYSPDYPVRNAMQDTLTGWNADIVCYDVVVCMLGWSATEGYRLNWSTYFGTDWMNYACGILLDQVGNVVFAGTTSQNLADKYLWFSKDIPYQGNHEGFIVRLFPNGKPTTVQRQGTAPSGYMLRVVTPQPAHDAVDLRAELPSADFLRFDLHDILGRHIAVLQSSRWYAGGVNHLTVPLPEISTGVYFIRMQGLHAAVTTKLLID